MVKYLEIMSETFHGNDQSPQAAAAELAARQAEVGAETHSACQDLASECTDELNQTPAGRLQLVCAEEGLSLGELDPASLLENRHLQVAFNRPLPMPPRIRERCVGILCETLGQPDIAPISAVSDAVADRQANLDNTSAQETLAETRVAAKEDHLEDVETREASLDVDIENSRAEGFELDQDLEVANTVIDDIFQNHVAVGTLGDIRAQVRQGLATNAAITDVDAAMTEAEAKYIAPHEARLNAIQSVFTSQEVQEVFGGSLAQTVSLNLRGENNAQIYADVFARIEAGITDDSRRRELRSRVEAQLGITMHEVEPPRNASDLQATLRDGRGVERETEMRRVEEPPGSGNYVEKEVVVSERTLPFTETDPVIINLDPRVEAFPIAPRSQTHVIKAYVTAGEPSLLHVDIPEYGALPTTDINNFVVSQQTQALLANHGYAGAINELLGAGDSTTGLSTNAVQPTLGQADPSRVLTQTLLGNDFAADGRFLSQDHLNQMEGNLRSLAVDGDFGAFNQMDASQATALMRGMLGEGQANVVANLNRLRGVINSGGAEAPSYQATYAAMYPEDAAAGFPRLREIVGDDGMSALNLGKEPNA